MTSLIVAGCALVGGGYLVRHISRKHGKTIALQGKALGNMFQQRYRGGFQSEIDKYEAGKILGISPNSSSDRIKTVHKKLMFQNHPDRGGSPFIAAKINSAKDYLDKNK